MNWIDIDQLLYRMIAKHDSVEAVYTEAQKHFKWDRSQVQAAVDPLLLRHSTLKPAETAQKTTKRKPK
jgi:hypothetical protein